MKKIFAFVLASIMVLSLVPASAFAAITKGCELPHTVDNCEWTKVDTIAATCEAAGYTVYECKACGEQFLADFVEALPHDYVLNEDKEDDNVTVSCVKGKEKNGVTYWICADCDHEWKEVVDWRTVHNLVPVAGSGYGCEQKYQCTTCKRYYYGVDKNGVAKESASHTWEFTKIITEPEIKDGESIKGEALYTCKVCKDTKTLEVFTPDCRCNEKALASVYLNKIKSAKSPTCTDDGTYAVYECKYCDRLYKKVSSNYTLIEDAKEAVRPALGHDAGDNKVTTEGCKTSYTCDRKGCGVKVVEYAHDINDPKNTHLKVEKYSDASCTDYGYSVWLCTICGEGDAVLTEPTGHKEVTVEVAPTCADFGYTYTYCTNEWCTLKEYGDGNVAELYKLNGIYYDVAVEDEDGNPVAVKVIKLYRGFTLDTSAHDFVLVSSEEKISCDQVGYDVYQCSKCKKMEIEYVAAGKHEIDEEKTEYKAPDCTNDGYIKQWCTKCEQWIETVLAANGTAHNFETVEEYHHCVFETIPDSQKVSSGIYYGRIVKKCTGCALTRTEYVDKVNTTNVQKWFDSYDEAELYHYGNRKLVGDKWVADYTDTLIRQDALCVEATCYSNGYDVYKCSKCDNTVYVTTEKLPHGLSATNKAVAATCTKPGNIKYYTCYTCHTNYIIDENGKHVTVTAADVATNPHSATLSGPIEVKDCTGKVVYTYWKCTKVNNKKTCGKLFADENAETALTVTPPSNNKIDHAWTNLVSYSAANCNTEGVVGVQHCPTCGKIRFVEDYLVVAADGTVSAKLKQYTSAMTIDAAEAYELKVGEKVELTVDAKGNVTSTIVKTPKFEHGYDSTTKEYTAITSTASMKSSEWDCSKPFYYYNECSLCDYEYLDEYKPASSAKGHVNKDGVALTGSCGDLKKIKDRVCFYCGEEVKVNHDLYSENGGQIITVPATCSTDGYDYDYCLDCGHIEIGVVHFADADEYHDATDANGNYINRVKVGVSEDYANNGDYYYACKVCNKALTKTTKVKCPGTGVELVLSSDAESYIAGSTIYVTVTLDSYKGVNVWGVNFPVSYDPSSFEFVGASFNSDVFPVFMATDIKANAYNRADGTFAKEKTSQGVISIAANAEENVLVKGEVEVVTLEFRLISSYAVPEYVGEFAIVIAETSAQVGVEEFFGTKYPKYEMFDIDVVDEKGVTVANMYEGSETLLIDTNAFLDIDGDGLSMSDALALYEFIVFDEYNVVADANCDGKVNLEDLTVLYNILTGAITVDEYVNPVVEEIKYDENGNAILPDDFNPSDGARN